jgi:glutaminyl-peptide cyclotransferase
MRRPSIGIRRSPIAPSPIGGCQAVQCSVLIAAACTAAVFAQSAPTFDSNRAWEHLRQMVAIGPRPSGSAAIEQTRAYIVSQLQAARVTVSEQAWDEETPAGKTRMVNLIATIPGARPDRILFSGHYDTKLFRPFRFVGADDGGSSAAFLIELARVLRTRSNPLTIEIAFLDGEEAVCENWDDCGKPGAPDNTYGSRHYVATARQKGTLAGIKANVLVDMIADRNLDIRRESHSTLWLTDAIWDAAKRLRLDNVFLPAATPIEDDHIPFLEAGVPSVDVIDLDYPAWHTAQDTLDAVSARSLQIVGDVVLAALPTIEARIIKTAR